MANHPELEQLMNKELQLRENGSPAEGKVIHIQPHKGGHLILVDMGYYKQEDVRDCTPRRSGSYSLRAVFAIAEVYASIFLARER